MAGVGQADEPLVSAGAAAQPLVTNPDLSSTDSGAVQNLVQAYHQGFVSADDIVNRIGQQATAQKKATLEALKEYVDPEMINARLGQAKLAGALVQPQIDAQTLELRRQAANSAWGGGVDAFQNYAPLFGHAEMPQNPDGSPDFMTMGKLGRQFMLPAQRYKLALQGLEVDPSRTQELVDPQTGKKGKKVFNKWGQEITPGSPGESAYRGLMMLPGMPGAAPEPGAFSTLITPQQSAPAQPQTQPVIPAPGAQPQTQVGTYNPDLGVVTGQEKGYMATPDEISAEYQKQKSYELWEQQKKFAQSFDTTAKRIEQIPAADQRSGKTPMNALDIALAESIIKLYDPGMAIREFKWDKLAEAQPYLERLPNWRPEFLKSGTLTPEGRQRLIEMGYDNIDGADNSVRPHFQRAAQQATAAGLDPTKILNADEQRVVNKQPFGTARPNRPVGTALPQYTDLEPTHPATNPQAPTGTPSVAKAAPAGKTFTIFSSGPYAGRKMVPNGDGSFSPAPGQ